MGDEDHTQSGRTCPEHNTRDFDATSTSHEMEQIIMPRRQKRRVGIASPLGETCIVEQTSIENVLKYTHIIPPTIKEKIYDQLEYCWRMKPRSLNLHSRYNIFILGTKFHYLFNQKKFLLLPADDVLQQYLEHLNPLGANDIPYKPTPDGTLPPKFKYRLVAHPSMRGVPIYRQESKPSEGPLNESNFKTYFYPYRDLPPIESHVLPHFVIFNAGYKLSSPGFHNDIGESGHYDDLADALLNVRSIYGVWMTVQLPDDFRKLLQENRQRDTKSDAGQKEQNLSRHRKRPRTESGSNAHVRSTKKSRGTKEQRADTSSALTQSSLRRLDREGLRAGEKKQRDYISRWREGVPTGSCGTDDEQNDKEQDDKPEKCQA